MNIDSQGATSRASERAARSCLPLLREFTAAVILTISVLQLFKYWLGMDVGRFRGCIPGKTSSQTFLLARFYFALDLI